MQEDAGATCRHDHPDPTATLTQAPAQLALVAAMCHALSDVSRLRLLLWLAEGERCVSELVALEQGKVSSVSARLKILHAARLVSRRRDAKHVFYALADDHVQALIRNVLAHAAEVTDVLPPTHVQGN